MGEGISQASKDRIAELALGLLEEQVQARIVHYKEELETNPELDAITAEVVAQLRELQRRTKIEERTVERSAAIAEQQERALALLLRRLFPEGAPTLGMEAAIKKIVRQLAKIFFQSELHERTRAIEGKATTIEHGEQALYYVLSRYKNRMLNELATFDFASEEIRERSADLLHKLEKDMKDAVLSRRSAELTRVVTVFNMVLLRFLTDALAKSVGELAREVIQQSGSAEGSAYGYKVETAAFPRFRAAFERRLMVRLVGNLEDELVRALADTAGTKRTETIGFVTNPQVFSMICGELANACYEFLYSEGFLDLPSEWLASVRAN